MTPKVRSMKGRVLNRVDTSENWATINPILLKGEMGIEEDTGLFKVGTGTRRWNDLTYRNYLNILTEDPNAESTHDQVPSAKALFNLLGGLREDLITGEKQLIPAINETRNWIDFADIQLKDILYSYEGFTYQVGQFEPRFSGSTRAGDITYIERTGEFVALGRIIAIVIHTIMSWTTATGPTGQVRLNDFPFIPDLANVQSGLAARASFQTNALISITTPNFTRFQFTQSNGALADLLWPASGTAVEFTVSGLYGIRS